MPTMTLNPTAVRATGLDRAFDPSRIFPRSLYRIGVATQSFATRPTRVIPINIRSARSEFDQLMQRWEAERPWGVEPHELLSHPVYLDIVAMGPRAVPLLLGRMSIDPIMWFPALRALTGVNPVPKEHRGRVTLMAQDWQDWGHREGYEF